MDNADKKNKHRKHRETPKNEYRISNPSEIKEKEDFTGQARNDE